MHMEDYEAAARYQDQAEEVAWDDCFDILSNQILLLTRARECEQEPRRCLEVVGCPASQLERPTNVGHRFYVFR